MGRPSKSLDNLNSHLTKAEIEQRKQDEQAALSGIKMRESPQVRKDTIAHLEFLRVRKILAAVGKNDAMYEAVMNDYCMLRSNIYRLANMRDAILQDMDDLYGQDIPPETRYKIKAGMHKSVLDCEKQINACQKKRFDIEKENGFTMASAARNISKKPKKGVNPLLEALRDDE